MLFVPAYYLLRVRAVRELSRLCGRGRNLVLTYDDGPGRRLSRALVGVLGKLGVGQAQLAFVHPVGTAYELFDRVVPRVSDVVEPIRACRKIAVRYRMRLVTEAIALCFLRGMEELAVEDTIPNTTVIDLDGMPFDYSMWRPSEGKLHGPPCDACAAKGRCDGPWREYPERFGWRSFALCEWVPRCHGR